MAWMQLRHSIRGVHGSTSDGTNSPSFDLCPLVTRYWTSTRNFSGVEGDWKQDPRLDRVPSLMGPTTAWRIESTRLHTWIAVDVVFIDVGSPPTGSTDVERANVGIEKSISTESQSNYRSDVSSRTWRNVKLRRVLSRLTESLEYDSPQFTYITCIVFQLSPTPLVVSLNISN